MRIYLEWHTETEDIALGEALVEALPPVGALIAYVPVGMPEPRPVSWRVVTLYIVPAVPGSPAEQRGEQLGVYYVFVEPAEGPYHP